MSVHADGRPLLMFDWHELLTLDEALYRSDPPDTAALRALLVPKGWEPSDEELAGRVAEKLRQAAEDEANTPEWAKQPLVLRRVYPASS